MTVPRKYILSLTILAVAVTSAVACVEVTVRILHPEMAGAFIVSSLDHLRHPRTRPDAEFHHVVNALAFPSPGDAFAERIMIVGDSFAMGYGVREKERLGTLLQQHLGGGIKIDVLATISYSPVIYRNLVRKALSLAPYRAVAVFVDQTDPADDLIYQEDVIEDGSSPRFDLNRMKDRARYIDAALSPMARRFSGWANVRRLAGINLLLKPPSLMEPFKPGDAYYRYIYLSFVARTGLINQFNNEPEAKESQEMLTLLSKHLDEITTLCRAYRVPLFLAANPWEFQVSPHPKETSQFPGPYPRDNRLETVLASRYGNLTGVYIVPLTQIFREQGDPSGLFLAKPKNEIHWNAKGDSLVESTLRRLLLSKLPGLGRAGRQ